MRTMVDAQVRTRALSDQESSAIFVDATFVPEECAKARLRPIRAFGWRLGLLRRDFIRVEW
jgi:hypothetical protein